MSWALVIVYLAIGVGVWYWLLGGNIDEDWRESTAKERVVWLVLSLAVVLMWPAFAIAAALLRQE